MANVQNMNHQTISVIVGGLSVLLVVASIIGGGAYWVGKIDTRIDAQDIQMRTLFYEQDRRLDIQFNGLEKSIEAVDERIEAVDERIDARIEAVDHRVDARIDTYDYHHHVEDGAVVFSPEGR